LFDNLNVSLDKTTEDFTYYKRNTCSAAEAYDTDWLHNKKRRPELVQPTQSLLFISVHLTGSTSQWERFFCSVLVKYLSLEKDDVDMAMGIVAVL
jgi:hypothetical protein